MCEPDNGNVNQDQPNSDASLTRTAQAVNAGSGFVGAVGIEQQYENAKLVTADLNRQAFEAESAARVEAEDIRELVTRKTATARAALAAAGVNVEFGSSDVIIKEINKDGEQDALITIKNGQARAEQLRYAAKVNKINARLNRLTGHFSNIMETGAKAAKLSGGG